MPRMQPGMHAALSPAVRGRHQRYKDFLAAVSWDGGVSLVSGESLDVQRQWQRTIGVDLVVAGDGVVGYGGEQEFSEARPAVPPPPISDRRLAVHHIGSFICTSITSGAVIIGHLSPRQIGLGMLCQWNCEAVACILTRVLGPQLWPCDARRQSEAPEIMALPRLPRTRKTETEHLVSKQEYRFSLCTICGGGLHSLLSAGCIACGNASFWRQLTWVLVLGVRKVVGLLHGRAVAIRV